MPSWNRWSSRSSNATDSTPRSAPASVSVTPVSIAAGVTNGNSSVTWAGTPQAADRSNRARQAPITGSASGTGRMTALWTGVAIDG